MTAMSKKRTGKLPLLKTTWELATYDVWGNAKDGWEVNDTYRGRDVELEIPQTRNNAGREWHVCHNPECKSNGRGVLTHADVAVAELTPDLQTDLCNDCGCPVTMESQEFISAYPTEKQIREVFGLGREKLEVDGDDLHITVSRRRDGKPIGEMRCTNHESLSPVKGGEAKEEKTTDYTVVVGNVGRVVDTTDEEVARKTYEEYVGLSKQGNGRCAGEGVVMMADGEVVREHMEGVKDEPLPPLEVTIARAKREILEDVKEGVMPATVGDFAELHDYTDANRYGGAFEFEVDAASQEQADYWNAVQDTVSGWIRRGGLKV